MEYFLTKEKQVELEEELKRLKKEGRREVSENLKKAKELGDLSENAQYIEAREEQQRIERRISELEEILKGAVLINKDSKKKREEVEVGATVEVARDGKTAKYVIVGSNESDPEGGFISNESPLGKELMGKREGESVTLDTPGGKATYKIKKIV